MESVIYIIKSNCDNRELARSNYMPPLGLMSIAATLRLHGYNVRIIDLSVRNYQTEEINAIIESMNPIMIGFSVYTCLLYTSPSPRDRQKSRMPSSA